MLSTARLPLLLGVLVFTAILAGVAREVHNQRLTRLPGGDPSAGWFSADPDGLYHTRRLARLLDEGPPVAQTDPLLSYPEGAPIPWPPYYTRALEVGLRGFAPEVERDAWLERAVATLPALFALLAAMVVAAAAWHEGGFLAAGIAGSTFAWLGASIGYSAPGIGDHHAWATLLMAVLFTLTAFAFGEPHHRRPRSGLLLGLAAGVVAALLVGSWVGGLVHVMIVQLALGWLVIVHGRRGEPALIPFGLAFHGAYALGLLPAVLASPWKADMPWMVVNLSWFHLAHAVLGAMVFAPLLFLWPGKPAARVYPWIVGVALLAAAAVVAFSDLTPAPGIREGFAWTGRANSFMAYITESQPLLVGQAGGPWPATQMLGIAFWLIVPAWCWAAWQAVHAGRTSLVIWVVAVPPMLGQALLQQRFAEAFGVPLAVVVGASIANLPGARFRPAWGMAALGLVLGSALQFPSVRGAFLRLSIGERYIRSPMAEDQRSFRGLYEWLGENAPLEGHRAVLAGWDQGHAIEWVAGRPTVATNFGSYVGEDGYLDPWRFFLSEDPVEAEALLERRQARHVLIHGMFSKDLEVMLRVLHAGERREFLAFRRGGPRPAARWFRTMSGRLLLTGKVGDPAEGTLGGNSLDFLRLVHVSPKFLQQRMPIPHTEGRAPAGWIWERVPGALLEARGAPGERLEVRFDVTYPAANRKLLWSAEAAADPDGIARLRVPYATDAPNGDGVADATAQWTFGSAAGSVNIPETAVLTGGAVELR